MTCPPVLGRSSVCWIIDPPGRPCNEDPGILRDMTPAEIQAAAAKMFEEMSE